MQRKGQAAMEFLMTYGWAILAAIVAIAVLAYFGVFSPSTYAPTICIMSAPLGCDIDSVVLVNDGGTGGLVDNVTIYIANGAGESINVTGAWVKGDCQDASQDLTTASITIANGEEGAVGVDCDDASAFTTGDTFAADVAITYTKGTGTRTLTSSGRISKAA